MKRSKDPVSKMNVRKPAVGILLGIILTLLINAGGAYLIHQQILQESSGIYIAVLALCSGIVVSTVVALSSDMNSKWLSCLAGGGGYYVVMLIANLLFFETKAVSVLIGLVITACCSAAVGLLLPGKGNSGFKSGIGLKKKKIYKLHK